MDSKKIQSIQRAIDIINCICSAKKNLSLKEISTYLNLNINTVRGIVNTLLLNGFLSKDEETNKYFLGYEFLTKSQLLYELQIRSIRDMAKPHMEMIADKYSATCYLQISFYSNIYTVETITSKKCHYAYMPKSGYNLPLYATASGKLLVAYMPEEAQKKVIDSIEYEALTHNTITSPDKFMKELDKILINGYATELEELDLAISSIAAPFFNAQANLVGTISIVAPAMLIEKVIKKAANDLERIGELITKSLFSNQKMKNRTI